MCNAWNHPSNCKCGWGGEGHLGKSGSQSQHGTYIVFPDVPRIIHAYESFVNPNASCPVCGESVFFYQSNNGGRVYFDELGPPWPKHPCTSNKAIPSPLRKHSSKNESISKILSYQWLKEGWEPFPIESITFYGNLCTRLAGKLGGKNFGIYVSGHIKTDIEDILVHVLKRNDSSYHCSIFDGRSSSKSIGYLFASALEEPMSPPKKKKRRKPKKVNSKKAKRVRN